MQTALIIAHVTTVGGAPAFVPLCQSEFVEEFEGGRGGRRLFAGEGCLGVEQQHAPHRLGVRVAPERLVRLRTAHDTLDEGAAQVLCGEADADHELVAVFQVLAP